MLVQQPRALVRKQPDPIVPGDRAPLSDAVPRPTSPLERNPLSPKGWKNRESGGVGLGIVAALEKAGGDAPAKLVVGAPNLHVSAPIAIAIAIAAPRTARFRGCCLEESEVIGCTGVASHGAKDGGDVRWRDTGFFWGSPPRWKEEIPAFPTADFLSHCYLCSKRLHGRDIYMYRGEKAFCSMECRYRQIVSDEFQEKCGSEASKPSEISSSAYSGGGRLFFTGIVAS